MRLAIFIAGALAALPALAEWTPVAPDNGIYAAYADRATIRRDGAIASMAGMYEFPRGDLTPEGVPFYSTTAQRDYDCRERRVRLMSYADHAQHLGQGAVVSASQAPRRWEPVVEGGIDAAYWKIACEAL